MQERGREGRRKKEREGGFEREWKEGEREGGREE